MYSYCLLLFSTLCVKKQKTKKKEILDIEGLNCLNEHALESLVDYCPNIRWFVLFSNEIES